MTLYGSTLDLYKRVIEQERGDKKKIYSLHEPEVECISKGKEYKKYEFGNKSAIAKTSRGLIVSAIAFHGNPYDGHTIPDHLDQMKRLTDHVPEEVVTDRGYRGKKMYGETRLSIPTSGSPGQSYYLKTKERRKFRNRAGIEPVVGHLKSDHRMSRNYLSGVLGDKINTLMAAAAYNMRHWMNKLPASSVVSSLIRLAKRLENMIFGWKEYRAIQWPVMAMLEK